MEQEKRRIPKLLKGILIVGGAAATVFIVTQVMLFIELKQQKPRIVKAFTELAVDLADERYRMDALAALLEQDELSHSGNITITNIDSSALDYEWKEYLNYLNHASVQFQFDKNETAKKARLLFDLQIYGISLGNAEVYMDETDAIFRIPSLHASYMRIGTQKIKEQYEKSLLYTAIKDVLPAPREEISIDVFQEEMDNADYIGELFMLLQEYGPKLAELYEQSEVTKLAAKKEILWDGAYQMCIPYQVKIPTELLKELFKDVKDTSVQKGMDFLKELYWNDEVLDLTVYLSTGKRILEIDGNVEISFQEQIIETSFAIYPKGVGNAWEALQLDIEMSTEDKKSAGFSLVMNHAFQDGEKNTDVQLRMTKPYLAKLLDMDATYNKETGELDLEFDISAIAAKADGWYHLSELTEEVKKPEGAIDIFNLELLELLQFTSGLNLGIFGK